MNQVEDKPPNVLPEPRTPERENWSTWRSFLAAVQFLTRLPIASRSPFSPTVLQKSPRFFPLVGAIVGLFTSALVGAGSLVWPVWLAVPVALGIEVLLTGALHEDAVADFCDAFGGGWTRDEILAILKDSRIGTYGALGLLFAIAIRAVATMSLVIQIGPENPWRWGAAIVASAMIGRWVMVLSIVTLPPLAQRPSLAQDVGSVLTLRDLLIAGLIGIPIWIWFGWAQPVQFFVAVIFVAITVWWFLAYVRKKLGGMTGDCVGCIGYVAQLVVLMTAAMGDRMGSDVP